MIKPRSLRRSVTLGRPLKLLIPPRAELCEISLDAADLHFLEHSNAGSILGLSFDHSGSTILLLANMNYHNGRPPCGRHAEEIPIGNTAQRSRHRYARLVTTPLAQLASSLFFDQKQSSTKVTRFQTTRSVT